MRLPSGHCSFFTIYPCEMPPWRSILFNAVVRFIVTAGGALAEPKRVLSFIRLAGILGRGPYLREASAQNWINDRKGHCAMNTSL